MGFQKTVLIVALVILTICIIFISTVISKNESKKQWPPETGTCPPYYIVSTDDSGVSCKRDPNAPKKSVSAYLMYQNAMRSSFKSENPGMVSKLYVLERDMRH